MIKPTYSPPRYIRFTRKLPENVNNFRHLTSILRAFSPFNVRVVRGSIIFCVAAVVRWNILIMAAQTFSSCKHKHHEMFEALKLVIVFVAF